MKSNKDQEPAPKHNEEKLTPEHQSHDDWDGVPLGDLDVLLSDKDLDDGHELRQISQVESVGFIIITVICVLVIMKEISC